MLVAEALDLFDARCEDQLKPKTVRFYRQRFKAFRNEFGHRELKDVKAIEIETFLARQARTGGKGGKPLSNSTRRHSAVVLETFQHWMLDREILDKPLFKKLEKPPMGRRERYPTDEETAQLLAHAPPDFARIYQVSELCGARPGEVCSAKIGDWDQTPGEQAIILQDHKTAGKTGKPRVILVSSHVEKLLRESVAGREQDLMAPLFLTKQGKAWTPEHYSRTYTRVRRAAGLPDGLVLYSARHKAITNVCRNAGVMVAKDFAGHSTVQTTQRYVHLSRGDILKAAEALKPVTASPAPQPPGKLDNLQTELQPPKAA